MLLLLDAKTKREFFMNVKRTSFRMNSFLVLYFFSDKNQSIFNASFKLFLILAFCNINLVPLLSLDKN